MTALLAVGFSFFDWSFFFDLSIYRTNLREVLAANFCLYLFIIISVKLLQLLRLLQKLLLHYYDSNVFRETQRKNLIVKSVEHNLEESFFDHIRGDVQLGHFILLSVPISQQLSSLTSGYFFSFLKLPLRLDCTFSWKQSGAFKIKLFLKAGNYFLASNKSQRILHAFFVLVVYPLTFVDSIECPDSATLNGKNTYCTTSKLCASSR